jgi:hypothetical protein
LEETVSKTQFVQDLQDRGVKGIPTKIAVKVLVGFE